MGNANHRFGLPLVAALLLGVTGINAAEPPAPSQPPEAKTKKEKELEARIATLEKRVQELEQTQDARGPITRFAPGQRISPRDMDAMWERFRRELEQGLGAEPPGFGGPGLMPPSLAQRPRLGVELAQPSADLAERFKNNVKEGGFVMRVVPGSPADKAGMKSGDAVTSFDGKAVKTPQDLIDAVRNASKGKHEVVVSRRGELLTLNVDLGALEREPEDVTAPDQMPDGGWLRREFGKGFEEGKPGSRTRTEIKASAFELTDQLATELKLSDEQRKKMGDILAKENKALTEDVASKAQTDTTRGGFSVDMTADVNQLVGKHVQNAENELAGVLSPEQLKQWQQYRQQHNSISMSYSHVIEGGAGEGGDQLKGF